MVIMARSNRNLRFVERIQEPKRKFNKLDDVSSTLQEYFTGQHTKDEYGGSRVQRAYEIIKHKCKTAVRSERFSVMHDPLACIGDLDGVSRAINYAVWPRREQRFRNYSTVSTGLPAKIQKV